MPRFYAVTADLILVVHALFVLFVVGGQAAILAGWARGWRWTRSPVLRLAHLAAIGMVVAQAWLGEACPLTVWEDALRERAGQAGYGTSFIGYWLGRLLFYSAPAWVFTLIYSLFGLVVALTFLLYPPRRARR
jgi:polyferredoxin